MTRLKRSALLAMTVALLTLAPTAAVYATDGANDRSDQATNRVTDRTNDKVTDRTRDPVTDRELDPATDRRTDRVTDRTRDSVTNRTTDNVTDRELRPWLKRCVRYVETHTDLELRRNLRWWWRVCHRVHWNLTHPQ